MRTRIVSLLVLITLVSAGLVFLAPAGAYTDIDSDVTGGTNSWTLAGSPYYIKDNITVPAGITLTIDPGVVVSFDDDTQLIVEGTVLAMGTGASPILFTSNTSVQGAYDGLRLEGSDSRLENTTIQYASAGASLNASQLYLENVTFSSNDLDMFFENGSNATIHNGAYNRSRLTFHDWLSELREMQDLSFTMYNPAKGNMPCDITVVSSNGFYINNTPQAHQWSNRLVTFRQNQSGPEHSFNPYNITLFEDLTPKYYYIELNLSELGDHHFDQVIYIDPYLTDFPRYINMVEEIRYDMWIQSGDPDNATNQLDVSADKEYIEIIHEGAGLYHFAIVISDPSGPVEHAKINITDHVNVITYNLQINISMRNDHPKIIVQDFVDLDEDVPKAIGISLWDEDDPAGSLTLTEDHPYADYNATTGQLEMLFPDDRYGTIITLNCTDGKAVTLKKLFVNLTQVADMPRLNGSLPDAVLDEEGQYELNLSKYFIDDDWGDSLKFEAPQDSLDLHIAIISGSILTIEAQQDVWGTTTQKIYATDETNQTVQATMNIRIDPLPDAPILTQSSVTPSKGSTNTNFKFEVKCTDADGEAPAYLWLILDGKTMNITKNNRSGDFYKGVFYDYETKLGPGSHSAYFQVLDTAFAPVKTSNLTVSGITKAVNVHTIKNGSIQIDIYHTASDPAVTFSSVDGLDLDLPEWTVALGSAFSFTGVPAAQFKYAWIYISYDEADLDYLYEESLKLVRVRGDSVEYINNSGPNMDMNIVITNVSAQGLYEMIADVDPDSDGDGDGYEFAEDAFPFDPLEWLDTDSDGIGNNADPDDDNDGFEDELEEAAGSRPDDPSSVPLDTDGDGLLDVEDDDDDNDGMPDVWEIDNSLEPLNASDALADPDGDGATNLEEYQEGTDPWSAGTDGKDDSLIGDFEVWILVLAILLIGIFVIVLVVIKKMPSRDGDEDEDDGEADDEDDDWDLSQKDLKARPAKRKGRKKKKSAGGKKGKAKAKKADVMDWDDDDELDLVDKANEAEIEDEEIEDTEDEWDPEEEADEDIGDDEDLVDDADIDADEDDLESFECPDCGEILPMSANKCPECKTEFED